MITLSINGRSVEVEAGTTILEACLAHGIDVPFYCYHPDIGIDGNCRMCLVEVNGNTQKLTISCKQPCGPDMKVETESPAVKKARKGVLEFYLINHPLDCTICDEAGQCPLQDYSYRHGPGDSRFVERKEKAPKNVEFSDKVIFDAERCILCTRCTRFFEEVRGSRPIGVENMGYHSQITLGPNGPITDPYQLNIVDICPVGALTSTEHRFMQRVWFQDFADTVCPGCARGCNMQAGAYQGKLTRFEPRRNPDVNKSWMCDDGRLASARYNLTGRLRSASVAGEPEPLGKALERLDALVGDGQGVAVLASTCDTCEDLYALRAWARKKGIAHLWHGARTWAGDDFLKLDDATPNTAGAQALGYLPAPAERPALRGLVVAGDVDVAAELLDNLEFLVLQAPLAGELGEAAMVLLPGRTPLEKRGSFINHAGLRQVVRPAVDPGEGVPDDWTIWRDLAGADWPTLKHLQRELAAELEPAHAESHTDPVMTDSLHPGQASSEAGR
jgi:NADH-quinone oxidoreductase subunit G